MSDMTIKGLQEAQEANLRKIRSLEAGGALGGAVKAGTSMAHQSAVLKTHVITGSLRSSHRIKLAGLRGTVFIDPSAVNPRSRAKPADYGPAEHARGGQHAFYKRVLDEDGARIARSAGGEFLRGMPKI